MAEHGIHLSESQIWRLVTGKPERLNLHVLMVLCEILGCEPGDLVRRQDTAAPVVLTQSRVRDRIPAGNPREW